MAEECLGSWPVKLIFLILIWAAMHHLLAGIRYLTLDLDIGLDRKSANLSAMAVTVLALILSVLTMLWVF